MKMYLLQLSPHRYLSFVWERGYFGTISHRVIAGKEAAYKMPYREARQMLKSYSDPNHANKGFWARISNGAYPRLVKVMTETKTIKERR